MKKENVEKLEVGKDYINLHDNDFIVIDRTGDIENRCFYDDLYKKDIPCINSESWREATEEEVIRAFKKYLIKRYDEDWRTMKIKERHPDSSTTINHGLWNVVISKLTDGWNVWNKNGLLYRNGIWVERLEEEEIKKSSDWVLAPEEMKKEKAIEKLPIDKVTIKNLDIALRMVGIQLDVNIIDRVIDLVELIENKGDDVTIKDIVSLQQTWSRHS